MIPTVTREVPPEDLQRAKSIAEALGVWGDGMNVATAAQATADEIERIYRDVGMPVRISELDIPREGLALLANDTLKNFNANPDERSDDYSARMLTLLKACW